MTVMAMIMMTIIVMTAVVSDPVRDHRDDHDGVADAAGERDGSDRLR
jgi:hypothetical protein